MSEIDRNDHLEDRAPVVTDGTSSPREDADSVAGPAKRNANETPETRPYRSRVRGWASEVARVPFKPNGRSPVENLMGEVERAIAELDSFCPLAGRETGFTYAIRLVTGRLTKIGRAINPRIRLRDIQTMNAAQLTLVGLAHGNIEHELHMRHAADRRHGEWFELASNPLPVRRRGCHGCDRRERRRLEEEWMRRFR